MGGFQCLGYDHNEPEVEGETSRAQGLLEDISERGESSGTGLRPILPKPAESVFYIQQQPQVSVRDSEDAGSGATLNTPNFGSPHGPSHFLSEFSSLRERQVHSTSDSALASHSESTRGAAHIFDHDIPVSINSAENHSDDLGSPNRSRGITRSATFRSAPAVHNFARQSSATSDAINELGQVMKILYKNLPRSINSNASMRQTYFMFTIGQYNLHLISKFFQPLPTSMVDRLAAHLMRPGTNLWILFMSAKMYEQLNKSPRNTVVRPFVYWINKSEQQITSTLDPNCSVEELGNRLLGLLELVFLKFMTINTRAGYSLLKRSLPTFLALVSTESTFWIEHLGRSRVSFARAINSPRFAIRRFVLFDIMTAFALGVPTLVQYDTSDLSVIPAAITPLEWIQAISVELAVNIVHVNSWRASNPGTPNANRGPNLELRTLAWEPRVTQLTGEDSYEVVARLAVQESWRQAILIYTYMGMYCVNSHDSRIQRAVRQIVQLIDVISGSRLEVHLLLPSLTAGVAARYEEQRRTVRNTLASFRETRVWLFPGAEFTPVLDHLWHGVAAGGASVTWEDYVHSRRTVYPLT